MTYRSIWRPYRGRHDGLDLITSSQTIRSIQPSVYNVIYTRHSSITREHEHCTAACALGLLLQLMMMKVSKHWRCSDCMSICSFPPLSNVYVYRNLSWILIELAARLDHRCDTGNLYQWGLLLLGGSSVAETNNVSLANVKKYITLRLVWK